MKKFQILFFTASLVTFGALADTQPASIEPAKPEHESLEKVVTQIKAILASKSVENYLTKDGDNAIQSIVPIAKDYYSLRANERCLIVRVKDWGENKVSLLPDNCENPSGRGRMVGYQNSVNQMGAILSSERFVERFDYRHFHANPDSQQQSLTTFLIRIWRENTYGVAAGYYTKDGLYQSSCFGGEYDVTVNLETTHHTNWRNQSGPGDGASV